MRSNIPNFSTFLNCCCSYTRTSWVYLATWFFSNRIAYCFNGNAISRIQINRPPPICWCKPPAGCCISWTMEQAQAFHSNINCMIRIGLIDEHALLRQSLKKIILDESKNEVCVLFDLPHPRDMLHILPPTEQQMVVPDIILIHVMSPGVAGREYTSFLKGNYPATKIIMISAGFNVFILNDLIREGVHGFVSQNADFYVLMNAIRAVWLDNVFMENFHAAPRTRDALTEKQLLFLRLCISELTYKEIADKMFLSPKTVNNYREELFRKLNIKSRTGLALHAIKLGLNFWSPLILFKSSIQRRAFLPAQRLKVFINFTL